MTVALSDLSLFVAVVFWVLAAKKTKNAPYGFPFILKAWVFIPLTALLIAGLGLSPTWSSDNAMHNHSPQMAAR